MALSDILQTINKETVAAIEEARKQGEEKKKELQAELDKELESKKSEYVKRIEYRANKKISQAAWEFTSRLQTAVLQRKKQLIDQVFEQAQTELTALSEKDHVELLAALFSSLPSLEKDATVLSASGSSKLIEQAMKQANCSLERSNDTVEAIGGFVVQTEDMNIDMTFESLIKAYRSDHEAEVAAKLF